MYRYYIPPDTVIAGVCIVYILHICVGTIKCNDRIIPYTHVYMYDIEYIIGNGSIILCV